MPAGLPEGSLFVLYVDEASRDAKLYLTGSARGREFSASIAVHAADGGAAQALPWLCVDSAGGAHILWIDNRTDRIATYSASTRDGHEIGPLNRVSDAEFEERTHRQWLGDFTALQAAGPWLFAAWTDTRDGSSEIRFSRARNPHLAGR